MVVLGIAYSIAILFTHAYFHVFRISVSGFIILSAAFLLTNLSATYLNVLYAHAKTTKIVVMQALLAYVMLMALTAGCLWRQITLCYGSQLLASVCTLFLFGYAVNRISRSDLTPSLLIAASVRAAPGIESLSRPEKFVRSELTSTFVMENGETQAQTARKKNKLKLVAESGTGA